MVAKKSKLPPARVGKKRKPRCGLCGQKMERGAAVGTFHDRECIKGEPLSHVSCIKALETERRNEAERTLRSLGFKPKRVT